MTQNRNKAETENSSIKSKDLLYAWDKYLFIIILQHYKFLELKKYFIFIYNPILSENNLFLYIPLYILTKHICCDKIHICVSLIGKDPFDRF